MIKGKLVVALLLLGAPLQALAGEATNARIVSVNAFVDGWVQFTVAGTRINAPAGCANNHFSFQITAAGGKTMLAMLLTAVTAGGHLDIFGSGTCSGFGSELVSIVTYFPS